MRAGDVVTYTPKKGASRDAVVIRHTGSGPSGYKTLDLELSTKTVTDVPHELDADAGAYWSEHAAPDSRASDDVPASVVPEAQAEGRAAAEVGDSSEEE